jgi:hypothetical protein
MLVSYEVDIFFCEDKTDNKVKKCETLNEKKKVIENYDKYDELI